MLSIPYQVVLFADIMRFTQPTLYLAIDFSGVSDHKMMSVITRRKGFYFGETRVFQPPGQNNVRLQAIVVQSIDRGEYHSHLESYSRSGRSSNNVAQLLDGRGKAFIQLDSFRRLAS